jgi:glycosyltransferase involved in cell wall biosynthesis
VVVVAAGAGEAVIVGMMRIKSEQRWIARVLESMLPVCEKIFILDDHSEDHTVEICRSFPQVQLWESPFEGVQETRDKNYLLEKVEAEVPGGSWVVCIDGDEQLADGAETHIRKMTQTAPARLNVFKFRVVYLWDSEAQYRADGIYADFYRTSLFRLVPGQRFKSSAGGGFHCGNAPEPGGAPRTAVNILHYGYLHRADRVRKYEWYNSADKQPIPPDEDGYRHMVIGDLFPSTAKFRWGGPLKLEPVEKLFRKPVMA